jgi:hypothetical protein
VGEFITACLASQEGRGGRFAVVAVAGDGFLEAGALGVVQQHFVESFIVVGVRIVSKRIGLYWLDSEGIYPREVAFTLRRGTV